ncbi:hypothetical protein G6O67_004889 [Ophiocordyceps sinensis]|uniref:Ankyrin repeat-containing domain protein n=3 Tax=Ophiocordyceps sinensis TaxID=72228 RepID=A0A8H4PQC8_9HYPO|nr:hypothetical protein G6O67_004889 [Ophiocordyceps sinensis]
MDTDMDGDKGDVGEQLPEEPVPSEQGQGSEKDCISDLPNEVKDLVCKDLDNAALVCLGKTDKEWSQWAARGFSDGGTLAVNEEVLRRALEHGGDVNAIHRGQGEDYATALHYAAAWGRDTIVRQLLEAGASVQALASGYRVFERCDMIDMAAGGELAQFGISLFRELKRTRWLPLLLPLIRRHGEVVKLLFEAGATARLGVRHENPALQVGRVITAFHIFATMTDSEFNGGGMREIHQAIWDAHRAVCMDAAMGQEGLAPLHISLEFTNRFMLTRLIHGAAQVDVQSALGRTPLMHAINLCAGATAVHRRKKLTEAVQILIRAGANVNAVSDAAVAETPLVCVVLADVDDWARSFRDLKTLLTILIDNGARINGFGPGPSILHALCEKVIQRGRSRSFDNLLAFLVDHKGDVNLAATPTGESILLGLIDQYEQVPTGFFHGLVNHYGATIRPGEVDQAFSAWLESPRLRSAFRGYDVLRHHGEHITAQAFERAWYQAFARQEEDLYLRLVAEDSPRPADASELVAVALRTPNHCLWGYVHTLRFDANYVSPEGLGWLHMIVIKLKCTNWRERHAVEDAAFLISRGTSVCIEDHEGLTALQQLRRLNQPYPELRLLLHEAKDRERGEI